MCLGVKFQLFNLFRCRVTSNSFYRFIERFYRKSILLHPVTSSRKLWTAISREQIKLLTRGFFCSSLFLKDCNISNYWKWVNFPFKCFRLQYGKIWENPTSLWQKQQHIFASRHPKLHRMRKRKLKQESAKQMNYYEVCDVEREAVYF